MPDAGSHQPASFSLLCPAKALVQRERKAHEFCYYNKYNKFNIELYSHKRAAKAVPKVVQLFLLVFYFRFSKRILDFQFTGRFLPFLNLENILSPKGTLRVAEPVWGLFDILSILLCLEKGV